MSGKKKSLLKINPSEIVCRYCLFTLLISLVNAIRGFRDSNPDSEEKEKNKLRHIFSCLDKIVYKVIPPGRLQRRLCFLAAYVNDLVQVSSSDNERKIWLYKTIFQRTKEINSILDENAEQIFSEAA